MAGDLPMLPSCLQALAVASIDTYEGLLMSAFSYTIGRKDFEHATSLAEETLALFESRAGHYNNNLNSHLRGKLGEIAATVALESFGLEPNRIWADTSKLSLADLEVPGRFRADVKTWDRRYWATMGRCIAVNQISRLRHKAEAVIWCQSDSNLTPGMVVHVVGWNALEDVALAPRRLTGPPRGRKVDNYQLDIGAIRPLMSILNHGFAL